MSYETQAAWIQRAFSEAKISSSKVTHTMRGAAARIADAEGVSEDQIRRAGHWERGSSMLTSYLSRLPREFIRVIAGFSKIPGNYFLRRAAVKPPAALKSKIWPWVDEWLARYDASIGSGCSFADGGLDECDMAGKQLLDLLDWFREIMLQDAAVLQQQFPLFPLWEHPVFCDPDWRQFADEVLVAHNTAEEPINMRIRKVLPEIEETIRSTRDAVLSRVEVNSAKVHEKLDRISEHLAALREQRTPDELVTVPRSLIDPEALNAYLANLPLRPSPRQALPATSAATNAVVTATAAPSSSSSSPSATARTSLIPLTAGGWPVQPFDPNVATVEDAWREWHVGLGTGATRKASILDLEVRFGCAWRYEQRIRQWHTRRRKVIQAIEQRVGQGQTLQEVFAKLNATAKSLDRLRKDIEKGVDIFL